MGGGFMADLGGLALFLLAIVALHELAHVAIARIHGYPVLCLALSPLAVGVAFLDRPVRRYWLLQVLVPMAVTTAAIFLGMLVTPMVAPAARLAFGGSLSWQIGFCVLLSALTSSGDVASMGMEIRRPVWGRDRVVRDVRMLKRMGSLIWFTAFGRRYLQDEFGLSPREFVEFVAAVTQRPEPKAVSPGS